MFYTAHLSCGCNPDARLTVNISEDERVLGSSGMESGSRSSTFKGKLGLALSHTDGICLNLTVWADDEENRERRICTSRTQRHGIQAQI